MGYSLSPCGLNFCSRSTGVVSTLMLRSQVGLERPRKAILLDITAPVIASPGRSSRETGGFSFVGTLPSISSKTASTGPRSLSGILRNCFCAGPVTSGCQCIENFAWRRVVPALEGGAAAANRSHLDAKRQDSRVAAFKVGTQGLADQFRSGPVFGLSHRFKLFHHRRGQGDGHGFGGSHE